MDAAAARRQHLKVALAVFIGLAGLGLAGCETSNSLFGSNTPVAPDAAAARPPAAQPALAKVMVAPIIGAPDAIAKQIQQELTSAIEKQRVQVVTNKDERADYTLRGYIVAAKDKNATKVSYIWDVTDPAGKRVNRITGEEVVSGSASKDPWAALSPAVGQSIASKAANSFGAWLPSHLGQGAVASNVASQPVGVGAQQAEAPAVVAEPPARPRPAAPRQAATAAPPQPAAGPTTASIPRGGPVMAVVPSVTGAPGDGSTSLTAAIKGELANRGVSFADTAAGGSTYRVEGSVTMGPPKDGKQAIQIEWLVRDPAGKKLGTVSQRNEIPEGSLDAKWGPTATQAASAAAQGIAKLLPQARAVN